jgi:methionyl-tRNA formyltransferase
VRLVVAATAEVAIPTLEWLKKSDHDLLRVVTTPDSRVGRGKVLAESPIARWADLNSIVKLKPSTEEEIRQAFENTDLVIAIAYGRILKEDVLSRPKFGFVNLHFSLLPSYRGAAPVQRAIQNGEVTTGITIFKIDAGLDTGPIYYQEQYEIPPRATSSDVLKNLSEIGANAIPGVLAEIEKGTQPQPQSGNSISLAPKIAKEEARINWNKKAHLITNLVRAFSPSPGAWTTYQGMNLKISELVHVTTLIKLKPGEIQIDGKRLLIGTADAPVEVLRVTAAGKKEMLTADWLNGARITSGDFFE